MARVTVEDCVTRVPNRFELVMLAAQRSRNIGAGASATLDRDEDKNPVIALREIAEGTVSLSELEANLIQSLQKVVEAEEPVEEEMDLLAIQRELEAEQGEPTDQAEVDEDDLSLDEEGSDEEAEAFDEEAGAGAGDSDIPEERFTDVDDD